MSSGAWNAKAAATAAVVVGRRSLSLARRFAASVAPDRHCARWRSRRAPAGDKLAIKTRARRPRRRPLSPASPVKARERPSSRDIIFSSLHGLASRKGISCPVIRLWRTERKRHAGKRHPPARRLAKIPRRALARYLGYLTDAARCRATRSQSANSLTRAARG